MIELGKGFDGTIEKAISSTEKLKGLPEIVQKYMMWGDYKSGFVKKIDGSNFGTDENGKDIQNYVAQISNLDKAQRKAIISVTELDNDSEKTIEKLIKKLHEETITDARDLNTIKTTGVYHLKTTSYTNGPGILNHATIFVDYTVGTPYQIFIPDSVNRAWRRNYVNSNDTWAAWTELKYTDTNTWRGIQNNLTSDSTSDSLSAAQGKALKTLIDGKAANEHTHQYLSLYGARPANINFTKSTNGTGAMFHFVATSSTTTGKPPADSSILQLNWDNNGGWDSQLALSTTANPHVYYRNQQNGTWGNWSTLLDNLNYTDYTAKKEHTHTKSQITDFPASLKNPTALTIQTNGAIAATYDGSAAKTVNITKGNIGLGNVDNTADANKSVKYATSAGNANTATKATIAGTADNATTSNGVKDYNDANKTIKIGFAGAGLTAENLNYIAGYTDNGTKIKDVSKDVLKSWIGLGNYLPLIGGTMSGQITKSTGGTWIGDRDRAAIKSSYAGDSSYGAVAAMATKNGYWTMGNLGGNESLIFNYSTDAKYNAGKNETSQVYLPAQAGTIITSATIGSQSVNYANSAGTANVSNSVDWSKVQNKPSSYAPTSHTHDDRYYTESEVNTKLANYQPKGNYAAASHTHNYAGSGSAGGSANSAIKLDSSAGSATQPVYFKDGKPVATTYALNKTVPADAKFTDTNTWRGIQNNLTSDSTDQSLSAAQGKALKALVDGKAPTSHKHTKSQITDFPSSMPASDVYAWAKAATKPSYTKAEVGLGNVDNTADKDKSVKHAASAESATTGLNGVSTCIFDSSSNNGSCVRFYNGLQICFGNSSKSSGVVFKLPFANDNYAVVVGGSDTLKNAWYVAGSRTTTGFNPNQSGFAVLFHWIAIGNWK